MLTKWIQEFQVTNSKPDEVVVFDVLSGDFNFDNCSPGTSASQIESYSLLKCTTFDESPMGLGQM
jgi:sphingomyelin phosphodiesterase 3